MTDLNSLLRDYAIESGELAPVVEMSSGDVLSEVLNDELEVAREPGLADKLEHADKAEAIAEQLDVLADRAEAQAAEDTGEVNAAVAQISAESLHREFATIMAANGLELKAASFESATDPKSQLIGLAKDARATSKVVGNFADNVRDLSTEGAVMQFLRGDKARLAKARTALESAAGELGKKKAELGQHAVELAHDGLKRFLTVKGEQVHDAKAAITHDIAWLKKAEAQVNKLAAEVGSVLASAHGEGDHAAAVEKLKHIAGAAGEGLEADLLGSHHFAAGKRGGGEKGSAGQAALSYAVTSFKQLPKSIALVIGGGAIGAVAGGVIGGHGGGIGGAALGGLAGGFAGASAGSGHAAKNVIQKTQADYKQKMEHTDAKSIAGIGDLQKISSDILSLTTATNFSMDESVENAGEKLEGASADAKAAGKKALSAVSKLADVVYEHAVYLTVKSAQLMSAAAAKG
jgi:hypothetical protein